MPRKTPAQLLQKIRKLQGDQEKLDVDLKQAQAEVRGAVTEDVLAVLNSLLNQEVAHEVKVKRFGQKKKYVFELSFNQDDIKNLPEVSKLISELTHLGKRTGTTLVEDK